MVNGLGNGGANGNKGSRVASVTKAHWEQIVAHNRGKLGGEWQVYEGVLGVPESLPCR